MLLLLELQDDGKKLLNEQDESANVADAVAVVVAVAVAVAQLLNWARAQSTNEDNDERLLEWAAGWAWGHEWNGLCQHKQAKRAKWPATNWDKDDTHTHTYTQQQLFYIWNGYVFWIQMPLYADGNASADLNKY